MSAKRIRFTSIDNVYLVRRNISKMLAKPCYHLGSVEYPLIVMATMEWSTQAAGDSIWSTDGLKH